MLTGLFTDGFFAALAAIGFAAISRPPRNAYIYCALIAAAGHATRYLLLNQHVVTVHIVIASFVASFVVGILAVMVSPHAKIPAETCIFPALLPMIPGMYAYRAFGGLAMCLLHDSEASFQHYFYLFADNGLTCLFILLAMVTGAVIPIFLFRKTAFKATRSAEHL